MNLKTEGFKGLRLEENNGLYRLVFYFENGGACVELADNFNSNDVCYRLRELADEIERSIKQR